MGRQKKIFERNPRFGIVLSTNCGEYVKEAKRNSHCIGFTMFISIGFIQKLIPNIFLPEIINLLSSS